MLQSASQEGVSALGGCLLPGVGVSAPGGGSAPGGVPGLGGLLWGVCLVPGGIPACTEADPPMDRILDTRL